MGGTMLFHQPDNSRTNYNYNARLYEGAGYLSHVHSNYELIYCCRGVIPVQINTRDMVLHPGEAVLVSPWAVHSFHVEDGSLGWVGVFSRDHVEDFAARYSHMQFGPFFLQPGTAPLLTEQLFVPHKPALHLRQALLYLVCHACQQQAAVLQVGDKDFRSRVLAYLTEHLEEEITMRTMAEALGYEYHYFSSLFHEAFHTHFKVFLNQLRFEKACRLLKGSPMDMTQVSTLCGFASIRNFNRVFRALSGVTPRQYRQKS